MIVRGRAIAKKREARAIVLHSFDSWRRRLDLGVIDGRAPFVRALVDGDIDLPSWVFAALKKWPTARALRRWSEASHKGGEIKAKASRAALDSPQNAPIKDLVLGAIAQNPFLTAHHIRALAVSRFGDGVPSIRSFQRHICRWREEQRLALAALSTPDAFKSRYKIAGHGAAANATRLNEVWEIDASPADVLIDDDGQRRKTLYACIDVYSRRAVVLLADVPSSAGVALLLRKALLRLGVPEIIRTDRGSDFMAKATQRLIASLGIELDCLPPASPQLKPFVERFFGTLQRDLSRTLPGFIGHKVADRALIEGGLNPPKDLLRPQELQSYVDQWVERYHQRRHSGYAMDCPPEVKAARYQGSVRTIEDDEALRLLLAPIAGSDGMRTITRRGIRLDGEHYYTSVEVGLRVFCRHDPNDQGRLYVFDEEGETYLGEAICPHLAGLDPSEVLNAVKARQREEVAKGKALIRRAVKSIGPRDVVESVLGEPAASDTSSLRLRPFGRRWQGRRAAGESSPLPRRRGEAPAASANEPADVVALLPHRQSVAPQEPLRAAVAPENEFTRFARAKDLRARLDRGEEITPDQKRWLKSYQAGAEYRGLTLFYANKEELCQVMRI